MSVPAARTAALAREPESTLREVAPPEVRGLEAIGPAEPTVSEPVSELAGTEPVGAAPVTSAESLLWVEQQLRRLENRESALVLSLPAPVRRAEAFLDGVDGPYRVFWHPPGGAAVAGIGAAFRIQLQGAQRFSDLRNRATEVFSRLTTVDHPMVGRGVPARLFGGLAFAVGAASKEPWEEFGDGCFTLPRWSYRREADRADLGLVVAAGEGCGRAGRGEILTELEKVLDRLENRPLAPAPPPRVLEIRGPSKREFSAQVEAIRQVISAGLFEKIVAANGSRVRLEKALETSAVLRRLSAGLRSSTRFAFGRDRATFLGATPERLISRRGDTIDTEALAGSIESGGEGGVRLLQSGKDRREHQLVVDEIKRRLRPLCALLDVADRPRIRELRDVLHLLTPISGVLERPRHVLDLVEILHPTPAVGGVPTEAAMQWIAAHEPRPRGWYAGPVGWFDAAGDGEFAVALRSAVLRGKEAFLYAGGGIVEDSDPELEFTETELKKQALLIALGA